LSRYSNQIESVGLRKCPYYRYLIEKVASTDVRITNISQSLPHKMAENCWYEEITSLSPYVYVFSWSILSDKTSHRSDLSPTWLQNEGYKGACSGTVAVHVARLTGINRGKTVSADFCKPPLVHEKIQLILKSIYSCASNFIVR